MRSPIELTSSVFAFVSRAADSMLSGAILSHGRALLIDPGVLPDELTSIDALLSSRGAVVDSILLTHHHWDHVLAPRHWPAARLIAHPALEPTVRAQQADPEYRAMLAQAFAAHHSTVPEPFVLPPVDASVSDGQVLLMGELECRILELPGHAPDAVGLFLPSQELLFSADMLDPNELPLPDQDRGLYLQSLAHIEALVLSGKVTRLVPGHGWPLLSKEAILGQLARDRLYLQST